MGIGYRNMADMKAVGKFIVTKAASFPETAHLPVSPIVEGERWKRNGARIKPDLAVMLPASGRYCPPEMHFAMGMLIKPTGLNYLQLGLKGVRRDKARIEMVKLARAEGSEFGLFLDDDNPPPADTIIKLLDVFHSHGPELAVVAGIYTGKILPAIPWVFRFKDNPEGFFWDWKAELRDDDNNVIREGEVFEVDAIASGCMMIRLSVFDTLKEPWFLEVHTVEEALEAQPHADASPRGYYVEVTDDMYFCHKLRAAGFRIMAHGGVLPGHWDEHGNCYRLAPDSWPMRRD